MTGKSFLMSIHDPDPNQSESDDPRDHQVPMRYFWIALAVALVGVSIGSVIVMRSVAKEDARRARPAGALGHNVPETAPVGMSWVPGGEFLMGSADGPAHERPVHTVRQRGFWMDDKEVANEQFEKFVKETRYVTLAERPADQRRAMGLPETEQPPGSWVLAGAAGTNAFRFMPGACWHRPEGAGSTNAGFGRRPVVHVAYDDASAYAEWVKKRLPSEAEWEYAARGGMVQQPFPWGRDAQTTNDLRANVWQGEFPMNDLGLDGYRGIAPVASFKPNGYRLHDMSGNVAEWCFDWFGSAAYTKDTEINPSGPVGEDGGRPKDAPGRVVRGGSWLSPEGANPDFRTSARSHLEPWRSRSDVGFRLVKNGPPYGGKL